MLTLRQKFTTDRRDCVTPVTYVGGEAARQEQPSPSIEY